MRRGFPDKDEPFVPNLPWPDEDDQPDVLPEPEPIRETEREEKRPLVPA